MRSGPRIDEDIIVELEGEQRMLYDAELKRTRQRNQVIAYRLLARGTVEEKIRALQRGKAALAAAVVQEESLTTVLDLESLRQILG